MANEVISKFATTKFSREFGIPSGKCVVSFDNTVGALCRGWLNYTPVDFCTKLLHGVEGCYVTTNLATAIWLPSTPKIPLSATKFIIHPVNLHRNHWGVIIAWVQYVSSSNKLSIRCYLYEPLIDEGYHADMEKAWGGLYDKKGGVNWCDATDPNVQLQYDPVEWVETPHQPDYARSGVMVVAQAYAFVSGNLQWRFHNVSKDDVKCMRLRMLWIILCKSQPKPISLSTATKTKTTPLQLQEQLN
ncbi:hypothetical protein PHMEG_0009448 [Phytophthora megakarya]|uniref:Ubiquitin-like protease family profile domain-containing protein n=1 Tax=Phytophthora megakarya TaxID=4795 RepID=A0A225WG76_9STRA|nr:hypothetical protein PHMEG_0009448 [Phytophthora megakarya]